MSEYYSNDENYEQELIYQDKTTIEKIFSVRTLKRIIKAILYFLVILVYGLLFFRLCTGDPPKKLSGVLWTEEAYSAYEEHGDNLKIYSHEPVEEITEDGVSGIYDVLYIPASGTLQMTVRYNESIIDDYYEKELENRKNEIEDNIFATTSYDRADLSTLTSEERAALDAIIDERLEASLAEDPILVSDSDTPFVFVLRDNFGNVYAEYSYLAETKTVYRYQRLSFEGVNLFGTGQTAPNNEYPYPETDNPAYFYKGANASESETITYLYLDMYYETEVDLDGEAYAYPIQVYVSSVELDLYDLEDEIPTGITEGVSKKTVTNTVSD